MLYQNYPKALGGALGLTSYQVVQNSSGQLEVSISTTFT